MIVGIDHATANDTFVCVPVAILDNGKTQTLEVCYADPQEKNRSLSPSGECALLVEYLTWLDERYCFSDNRVPILLSVDGAASTFIQQLKHTKNTSINRKTWKNVQIKGFTMKKKDTNMGIIKNAFAYNVLTILNEGVYTWNREINKHRLAKEIEAQRYKAGKLDPTIPNDFCDALEYGLVPYYSNCYNISFPIRINRNPKEDNHYNDIRKSAKIK